MGSRGCSVGCLSVTGAFWLAVAFTSALGTDGFGVLLVMGVAALAAAFLQARKGLAEQAAAREAVRGLQEKKILDIAARHDGQVSPAQVAMETTGLTVKAAKAFLDDLARDGFCTVDSDDSGHLYYRFAIGQAPDTEEPEQLSPDEWVERMSGHRQRRMTGREQDNEGTIRL